MKKTNQKQCININFSEGLGIFDANYRYPEIDNQEINNGPTGKVKDIQGIQAHAGRDFFAPEGKEFSLDIEACPYLHIAIKAGKDTKTCLLLMVHDKKPDDHKNRFVVIGKTPEGDPGIYDVITGCFTIEDDDQWHEYDLDLRKIREKDEEYPFFPGAGSVSIIEFYSWTGSGEHTFHFNDLVCKPLTITSKPLVVKGHIVYADGKPYAGAKVQAFDKDLRNEEPLDTGKTDAGGYYEIQYSPEQFRRVEKGSADLLIKIFTADGSPLASPVLYNAPPVAEVNLTIPAQMCLPLTLFEKIDQALPPLLEGLMVAELEENKDHQDVSFLSGEMGFEKKDIARFVIAHIMAQEGLQPEFWFALLDGSFFKFAEDQSLKEQTALILNSLPSLDAAAVKKTLIRSLNQKEIPEAFREKVPDWVEAFLQFAARCSVSGDDKPTFVKSALEDAGITIAQKQEKFARLFNEYKQLTPALLEALEHDPSFQKEEIADLRTSFQLAELTRSDFSFIKMLKEEYDVHKPEKIRSLAKKSESEWVSLVKEKHAAGDIKLPIEMGEIAGQINIPEAEVYGKMLERQFREAFPTTSFSGGLERALHNGGAHGLRHAEALGRFLDGHQDFEFLNTPVDDFFKNNIDSDFRELAEDKNFRLEVKAVQRVFKLVPTFEATDALLADDLHSAQKVYRMGKSEFVRRYADRTGFTAESALLAWNRATDTHAAVLTFVADLKALEAGGLPLALRNNNEALKSFPNWNNLFQTGDLCECEQCRSALGPAAYFVDLLVFLKDRYWNEVSVKDILFRRRADLGYLELNCDNALTPLPYIDVVCEVLEDVVAAGENDLELTGFDTMPADPAIAKQNVRKAFLYPYLFCWDSIPGIDNVKLIEFLENKFRFDWVETAIIKKIENDKITVSTVKKNLLWLKLNDEKTEVIIVIGNDIIDKLVVIKENGKLNIYLNRGISLGADFSLSQVTPGDPDRWVVHGDDVTYLLKKKKKAPSISFFAEILRNTKASAAELRAYPQYVNPEAYKKLRAAKYPLTLPFDLFSEEVRAAFQKINLQRWDLMRILRGSVAPYNPTDGDIAAEYFGISISADPADPSEKRLILTAEPTDAEQQTLWDEAAIPGNLTNVKVFLQKTGLEYNELLALLDLKFINPAGDIDIQHPPDPSCDIDQKIIQVLDAPKLDRIHRFLRLWRKLKGWKMWELDLVIRHFAFRYSAIHQPSIGSIDETFLINLFYFSEVKNKLGSKTTVEQTLALFGNLNTQTSFTKLHEKRADGLYQNLFLNKKLIQPLEVAFAVANVAASTVEKIVTHQPAVLAALGIREADLVLLTGMTKASGGKPYITDNLILTNLSFLWRHAWLSKTLKFKVEDWKNVLKFFPQTVPKFPGLIDARNFLEKKYHIKTVGLKPTEVDKILLKIFHKDISDFACPKSALEFLERIDHIKATGFTPDELNWLLAADRSTKVATKETEASHFLLALRKELQTIQAEHNPAQYDFLTAKPPNDVDRLTTLLTSLLQKLNRDETETQFFIATLQDEVSMEITVAGLPANFDFPDAIKSVIRIRYDKKATTLRFTGLMRAAEQTTLLAVTNNTAYQAAINEFFTRPRLALKFFEPVFTTPLATLPEAVDFKTFSDPALALKIFYDAEQRLLRFAGILSQYEKAALDVLSTDAAYRKAVDSLFTQPAGVFPSEKIWLQDADLLFPLRDLAVPAKDNLATNLTAATTRALAYLSKTLSEKAVVQEVSAQLGLTDALTRRLVTHYPVLPDTLLTHLTGAFAATTGAVDYATLKTTFDGWFWASRVATIWKKWKITLEELDEIIALTAGAKLLDFLTLPLSSGTIASLEKFLRTSRLLKMRDSLPEGGITLLKFLEKLNNGMYAAEATVQGLPIGFTYPATITAAPNHIPIHYDEQNTVLRFTGLMNATQRSILLKDASLAPVININNYQQAIEALFQSLTRAFAVDVQHLNEAWLLADVEAFTTSLDLAYPIDYLLAESWERLHRAFYFLDNLNAGTETVKTFTAPAMTNVHAKTVKELLRSKFGAETWLTLSIEIQDVLRERKRDALAAFLLTQPPADAPSGKWENTNDLYAYYLLDVEMSSCQLTSRLVLGSGSIQLFVQRCFMGLEPDVVVQADGENGDSAWRWWKWMRKFQVWVANRKVFLWPENWIEPELKKDRSTFFKDFENELLQNEVNQDTVETAFSNYLEKLDGVAQLEIAGFYQEDDGDNAIIHVFGRTAGAEPHLYYYRSYDYRQWTPWEKVELDIQGDYLIPAVVNKRLFLFWPVFTEVPDDAGNSSMNVPLPGQRIFVPDKIRKKLRLQMAVSDYRQGKWTSKRVSKDFDESKSYTIENVRKNYQFFPIDQRNVDGRFVIQYDSQSVDIAAVEAALAAAQAVANADLDSANNAKSVAYDANSIANEASRKAADAYKTVIGYVSHAENLVAFIDNDSDPINHSPGKKTSEAQKVLDEATETASKLSADFGNDAAFVKDANDFKVAAFNTWYQCSVNAAGFAKNSTLWALDLAKYVLDSAKTVRDALADDARTAARDFRAADIKQIAAQRAENVLKSPDGANAFKLAVFNEAKNASLSGAFEISGCKGAPEKADSVRTFTHAIRPEQASVGDDTAFLKWVELTSRTDFPPQDDFTLVNAFSVQPPISDTPVLGQTPDIFKMSSSWQLSYMDKIGLDSYNTLCDKTGTWLPFFYNDKKRTFFVLPSSQLNSEGGPGDRGYYSKIKSYLDEAFTRDVGMSPAELVGTDLRGLLSYHVKMSEGLIRFQKFHFKNFYHPFVCDFAKLVYNPLKGIPSLMSRETQLKHNDVFSFELDYDPNESAVVKLPPEYLSLEDCYPREVIDFTPNGAYSPYNWELFFHAPLLIANSLSKNQRFEEAREWYHFIFNPIGVESPTPGGLPMSKYWITKPFFENTDQQYVQQRIDNILRMLAGDTSVPGYSPQAKKDLEDQVVDWRTNPFEPHRIANYRTVAYQKTVVMKYLDNLIAWGDNLFRQDSMESINEATQLYVLTAEILGPRPKRIPPKAKPPVESFNELETKFENGLNRFGDPLVELENLVPVTSGNGHEGADPAPLPMLLYFCIPQNDKMLGYWDTVADRLYKIRHCMNIEGVVRQLALFEPPIDPAALVKAVAGGVDINAALADLNAPLPLYRFNVLLQKANEVCSDVKALGGALLAALEKKDTDAMGLLRQSQEIRLLEAVKTLREKQIEEAKEKLLGVKKSKELTEIKKKYYESREFMNAGEILATVLNSASIVSHTAGTVADVLAGVMFLIPDFKMGASGFGGSPHFTAEPPDGKKVGESTTRGANGLYNIATILDKSAALASTLSSYQRREEEWRFQEDMAVKEAEKIDKEIAAAELSTAMAEKELANHVIQIENAKATDEFMRSKYTNQELYLWQVGQISGVYFQSYRLAYDLAKRAERCFRFELGLPDSSYINFGYWDSLKKGLLSGEKLQYDLRRLESAYLEQNRREFELTKHVSLALLDPLTLVKLRETGRCFFRLPEEIFDLDYPGHYFRRLKSVSLTLPCVMGPYTTISCTLRLLKNSVRINTANRGKDYSRNADDHGLPVDDDRFIENNIPVKAIAASNAQNDSGVFELSFRDERYLPFEGAGAVSEWSLELFNDNKPDFGKSLRQFDYNTISDAILHIKYTAREDAGAFKNDVITHLRDYFSKDGTTPSLRLFNLRQEFPTQWHRFLNPTNPADGNVLELEMSASLFPMRDLGKTLKVNTIWLLARCTEEGRYNIVMTPQMPPPPTLPTPDPIKLTLPQFKEYGGLHFGQKDVSTLGIEIVSTDPPVKWQVKMTRPDDGNLQEDPEKKVMEVEDVLLVLGYEWE